LLTSWRSVSKTNQPSEIRASGDCESARSRPQTRWPIADGGLAAVNRPSSWPRLAGLQRTQSELSQGRNSKASSWLETVVHTYGRRSFARLAHRDETTEIQRRSARDSARRRPARGPACLRGSRRERAEIHRHREEVRLPELDPSEVLETKKKKKKKKSSRQDLWSPCSLADGERRREH